MNVVSYSNMTNLMTAISTRIQEVSDMIAGEFSASVAYDVDDIVVYDGALYKFKTAHAIGAWDATQVDEVTVADFIPAAASVDELTSEQLTTLIGLL